MSECSVLAGYQFSILKAAQKYLYANQLGELNANNEEKEKRKEISWTKNSTTSLSLLTEWTTKSLWMAPENRNLLKLILLFPVDIGGKHE